MKTIGEKVFKVVALLFRGESKMKLRIIDQGRFLCVRRAVIHHQHAWGRSAALFIGILFFCVGTSAQVAIDKTPNGIQSPLPSSVLQVSAPKVDLSAKSVTNQKWNFFDRDAVAATT